MIGIIDYGAGNLFSLKHALDDVGAETVVSGDASVLSTCGKLILPGVGAFGDGMAMLKKNKLDQMIISEAEKGKPLLGICLGMQMLYESSEEDGFHKGLGLLKGNIIRLQGDDIRIPEVGWNLLEQVNPHPVFSLLSAHPYMYYVHSYFASDTDPAQVFGISVDGINRVPGLVGRDNILGCQFHPEKSSEDGRAILRYFVEADI
ncbi:MAG: imidazole glycerol phosphate synthase subunit HisH [Lactimicrobium sp.]|jgi:glutamine amidotransferase|uniref:imidazole glycerol phosphate synthase subunit HisH n=1 Tax=Lactimicrobium sp. TaxID=2563780 RepID=UPI002F356B96